MKVLRDLAAPAKINLFLHITGRRSDGYHLIESVFQLIDWYDSIHLEVRPDSAISREDIHIASALPADDLCVRAARALQQASGCRQGAHIQLEKRIPSQAGMGGGSSDAATCLLGLNHLWKTNLSRLQLSEIALKLGADIPFFIMGRNAWVSGVGERIEPLPPNCLPPEQTFIILKPCNGLSTPSIFGHPALKRDTPHATIAVFAENPYGFGRNDLQNIGELIEPQVSQAIDLLSQQGLNPRMTGSGSAVFAHCPPGFQWDTCVVPPNWQQRVCRSIETHPLRDALEG